MRVCETIEIAAPPQAIWSVVADHSAYLHFMAGITRWEPAAEQTEGVGARFHTLMRVRSAEVGGLIEIVEWEPPRDIAWTSVHGVDQRGRWRLREREAGRNPRTHVELRLSYGIAGAGLAGWLAERLAAPTVRGHLRGSVEQLKRRVEHDQLRAAAAARRRARAGSRR